MPSKPYTKVIMMMILYLCLSPRVLTMVPTAFSMAFEDSIKLNIIAPANTMKIISEAALKPRGMALNISKSPTGDDEIILKELGTTTLRPSIKILS